MRCNTLDDIDIERYRRRDQRYLTYQDNNDAEPYPIKTQSDGNMMITTPFF